MNEPVKKYASNSGKLFFVLVPLTGEEKWTNLQVFQSLGSMKNILYPWFYLIRVHFSQDHSSVDWVVLDLLSLSSHFSHNSVPFSAWHFKDQLFYHLESIFSLQFKIITYVLEKLWDGFEMYYITVYLNW